MSRFDNIILLVLCINVCTPIAPVIIPNVTNTAINSTLNTSTISNVVGCSITTVTVGGGPVTTYNCTPQPTGGGAGILSNIFVFGDYLWGAAKGIALYLTEFTVVGVLMASFGIPSLLIVPFQIIIWFLMARWIVAFISGRAFVVE